MENLKVLIGSTAQLLLVAFTFAAVIICAVAWIYPEVKVEHKYATFGIAVGAVAALAHLYKK